jgi:hypothetical protein
MIYLYVKTHNKTGLKYLGKTTNKFPHLYKGSGKYWRLHCKKHGYDVTTEIIFQSQLQEDIKEKGLYYSKKWDIVNSDNWANLKEECGDGGGIIGSKRSEETKLKSSLSQKGKPRNQIFNITGLIEAKKIKITCKYCCRSYDLGNHGKYHGEKCKMNPNVDFKILEERSKHAKKAAKASVLKRKK